MLFTTLKSDKILALDPIESDFISLTNQSKYLFRLFLLPCKSIIMENNCEKNYQFTYKIQTFPRAMNQPNSPSRLPIVEPVKTVFFKLITLFSILHGLGFVLIREIDSRQH